MRTTVALPASAIDQATLLSIFSVRVGQRTGSGGKPTIKVSGANVQPPLAGFGLPGFVFYEKG